jgi:hypothetical protein
MYYNKKGQDFRLLMNLLAEKQDGLAQSFRILSVFDKHFQRLWRPKENKVIVQRPLLTTFSYDQEDIGKFINFFHCGVKPFLQ